MATIERDYKAGTVTLIMSIEELESIRAVLRFMRESVTRVESKLEVPPVTL